MYFKLSFLLTQLARVLFSSIIILCIHFALQNFRPHACIFALWLCTDIGDSNLLSYFITGGQSRAISYNRLCPEQAQRNTIYSTHLGFEKNWASKIAAFDKQGAQWKRAGPITQRSMDRNDFLLKNFLILTSFKIPFLHWCKQSTRR